jgi:hypothetical protein
METKAGDLIKGVGGVGVNHMDKIKVFWRRSGVQVSRNRGGMFDKVLWLDGNSCNVGMLELDWIGVT